MKQVLPETDVNGLASGMYFYRIRMKNFAAVRMETADRERDIGMLEFIRQNFMGWLGEERE